MAHELRKRLSGNGSVQSPLHSDDTTAMLNCLRRVFPQVVLDPMIPSGDHKGYGGGGAGNVAVAMTRRLVVGVVVMLAMLSAPLVPSAAADNHGEGCEVLELGLVYFVECVGEQAQAFLECNDDEGFQEDDCEITPEVCVDDIGCNPVEVVENVGGDVTQTSCTWLSGVAVVCATVEGDASMYNREEDSYFASGRTWDTYRRDYNVYGGGSGSSVVYDGYANTPNGDCYWVGSSGCSQPVAYIGDWSCYESKGCNYYLQTRACTVLQDMVEPARCATARVKVV